MSMRDERTVRCDCDAVGGPLNYPLWSPALLLPEFPIVKNMQQFRENTTKLVRFVSTIGVNSCQISPQSVIIWSLLLYSHPIDIFDSNGFSNTFLIHHKVSQNHPITQFKSSTCSIGHCNNIQPPCTSRSQPNFQF